MRIDELTVENFRGFRAERWRFHESLNVIVGDNGTGKSALLDAMAIGVGSFFLGVDGASARAIEADDVRRVGRSIGDQWEEAPCYPVVTRFRAEVLGASLDWHRVLPGAGRKTTSGDAKALATLVSERLARISDTPDLVLPLLAYHGTGRLWVQRRRVTTRPNRPRRRTDGYHACLEAASDEETFIEWFKSQEWQAYQEGHETLALRVVRESLRQLLPGCADLRFREREGELVAIFHDGRRLPTRLLSDGFRTILGLASDLAWRCATLNPHLGDRATRDTPGVVLVDEIDLHLHPNWQQRVLGDLRRSFPKVQFFVTTHSPFIVQSVSSESVVALSGPMHLDKAPYLRGIEEVATDVLGVAHAARSERFHQMERAAEDLFRAFDAARAGDPGALDAANRQYLDLAGRYADDPAFLATLRVEGAMRGVRVGAERDKAAS